MKVIIPMSGFGKRFLDAHYERPKPLIRVDGKPIIEHVISMFPSGQDFIFICAKEHLNDTDMESVLKRVAPRSKIISIPQHSYGPVFTVKHIFDEILDDEDLLITYCDYYMEWDFEDMIKKVKEGDFAGAVPSYTGFHPHLLRRELYGGVLVEDGVMKDYMEKHSFTYNPEESHHSVGAYYFSNGKLFKKYAEELYNSNIRHDGEAYVSMIYYLYLRDGHKIYVPEAKKFMQWGTPTDLEEYESWSRHIHKELGREKGKTDIPEEREKYVKIPYDENSEEFKKCYTYWKYYFLNTK